MTTNKNNTNCPTATTSDNNNSTLDNNEHIFNITSVFTNNDDIDDSIATISSNLNNEEVPIDSNNIINDFGCVIDDSKAAGMTTGSIAMEYKRIQQRTGWHRLYQDIREKSEREAAVKNFSTNESEKIKNRGLNRYRDVNPYDHSRIILHRGNVDYINANLVKVKSAGRQYILTQGPLADTVAHFWLMVWEQNSRAILMLNKIIEKKQNKCHKYWPDHVDHPLKFPEVKLTVEFVRSENYKNFLCRWFKLYDEETKESRNIIQFHYITWPDFGIPSSPVTFLQFLKQVRKSGTLEANIGPAVVHCSAGIGRSGTFCLVDCCLVLFEKEGENKVSVQDVLSEMRRYRMGLIQTADQLYFSYQAIIEGIKLLKDPDFLKYDEVPTTVHSTEDKSSMNIFGNMSDNNEKPLRDGHCENDELPPPLPPRINSLYVTTTNSGPSNSIDCYNYLINHQTDELKNIIDNGMLAQRPLPPLPPLPAMGLHHDPRQRSLDRVHESYCEENDECIEDVDDYDSDNSMSDDNADIAYNDNDDNYNMYNDDNSSKKQSPQEQKLLLLLQQHQLLQEEEGNHSNANNTIYANDNNNIEMTSPQNILKDLMKNTITTNQTPTAAAIESTSDNLNRDIRRRLRAERRNNLEEIVKEIKRMQRESDVEAEKKGSRFSFIRSLGRRPLVAYLAAGVLVGAICVYAYTKMG